MRQLVIHINDLKPAKIGNLDEAFWHTRHFLASVDIRRHIGFHHCIFLGDSRWYIS